jgi:hypothetical protein
MKTATNEIHLVLRPMHAGQAAAYWALKPHRFKALRCGRRFGKTEYGKNWIAQGLIQATNARGLRLNTRLGQRLTQSWPSYCARL